jgi:hypothetical protein
MGSDYLIIVFLLNCFIAIVEWLKLN